MTNPDLLSLPTELLLYIVEYIAPDHLTDRDDVQNLLSFRSTCRTIQHATLSLVASLFFSTFKCLITQERSLKALLGVSHHLTFAKYVKRICLSFVVIDLDRILLEEERPMLGFSKEETQWDRTARRLYREVWRNRRRLEAEQKAFQNTGQSLIYLREILANFKIADNIPSIQAYGEESVNVKTWFQRNLEEQLGSRRCLSVPQAGCEFEILHQAIRDTKFPVMNLRYGLEHTPAMPQAVFRNRLEGDAIYTHLQSLDLDLRDASSRSAESAEPQPITQALCTLLLETKQLERLVIRGWSYSFDNGPLDAILSVVTAPAAERGLQRLRMLALLQSKVRFDQLCTSVRAMRSTLENLFIRASPMEGTMPKHPELVIQAAHGGEQTKLYIRGLDLQR